MTHAQGMAQRIARRMVRLPRCLILRGWLCVIALVLAACASQPPAKPSTYEVKRGDTLYSIAWRNGVDYRELARLNGIGRDFAIQPGQVLKLSSTDKSIAKTAGRSSPSRSPSNSPVVPVKWVWPVRGSQTTLTSRPNGGQGLTITGTLGQEIRAAGSGRVVYKGTGMLGYGQLVIIKHNDSYLSAYGHTQSLRVKEGDEVKSGQVIATMGAGPKGGAMLYFEIRLNGRPVDPSTLLPK
jgi:lipoprotein NlpD